MGYVKPWKRHAEELRERAIRWFLIINMSTGRRGTICSAAENSGPQAETVRKWVRREEIDAGRRPGASSDELAELKRLKRENVELRRANDILKAAAHFFGAETSRPV